MVAYATVSLAILPARSCWMGETVFHANNDETADIVHRIGLCVRVCAGVIWADVDWAVCVVRGSGVVCWWGLKERGSRPGWGTKEEVPSTNRLTCLDGRALWHHANNLPCPCKLMPRAQHRKHCRTDNAVRYMGRWNEKVGAR